MISSLLEAFPEFATQDVIDTAFPKYWGFARKDGKWYVVKGTTSGGVQSYRYATLSNNPLIANYAAAWTARATLTYEYLYQILI